MNTNIDRCHEKKYHTIIVSIFDSNLNLRCFSFITFEIITQGEQQWHMRDFQHLVEMAAVE